MEAKSSAFVAVHITRSITFINDTKNRFPIMTTQFLRRTLSSSSLMLLLLATLFAGGVGARNLQSSTLVELVVADPDLETLEAAVVAAGLVDALNEPGPFTVFAPLNRAFACLEGSPGCPGSEYLTRLLTPEFNLHLQNYLAYHVAEGMVLSSDLSNGQELTMLNGETLTVSIIDGGVFLTNPLTTFAIVTDPDVRSCYVRFCWHSLRKLLLCE